MAEHAITYSDLKFDRSKRQKPGDKVAQEEMTTYSELKFQKPPKKKRSARLQEAEGRGAEGSPSQLRRNQDPSVSLVRWRLTAVVLGILCMILLVAAGVLGIKVTQLSQEKENPIQCPASCPEPNTCVPGRPQDQPPEKEEKCLQRWSHSKSRSYLFSPEKRPWAQCKSSCSSHSASLLMIDSPEERDFINTESFPYSEYRGSSQYYYPFWTGLSYNSETKKWVWADGTALSPGLIQLPDTRHGNYAGGGCVYMQSASFKLGRCEEPQFCICEKIKAAG